MTLRVLVLEPVAETGLKSLVDAGIEVIDARSLDDAAKDAELARADALVVRSGSVVDAHLLSKAPNLKAVARAGVGLDNIDLDEATRRGIAVANTPGGNAVAAAELTFAHMLALCRHLSPAHASLLAGRWDRHNFVGSELARKQLGVIGLGRIGVLVATRAKAFDMEVSVSDPFLTEERAELLGVNKVELEELLPRADIFTLHVPLTESTRNMLGSEQLALMKPTAMLVNVARGGLIDEAALHEALAQGRLAGAAIDVFGQEPPDGNPLLELPNVLATPHLGASTVEAKENVSHSVAESLLALLIRGDYSAAVNLPYASADLAELAPLLDLAERMGRFQGGLLEGAPVKAELELVSDVDEGTGPLIAAFLCGLLREAWGEEVNPVNARIKADQLGLSVSEGRRPAEKGYPRRLVSSVHDDNSSHQVEGGLLAVGEPRINRVDGHWIDLNPRGDLLVMRNDDVPGVMGKVGMLLGQLGINIGDLRLGRGDLPHKAISVWQVDSPIDREGVDRLMAIDEIDSVRQVRLGS